MDKIKLLFLKMNYPFLKHVKIKSNEGVFDLEGIDIHIFTTLYNIFKNSNSNIIFDIDRPINYNLSISNLFLDMIPNASVVIFDELTDIAILNNLDLENYNIKFINSQLDGGLIPALASNNKYLNIDSANSLFKLVSSKSNRSTLLAINSNNNIIEKLKNFISLIKTNSFLIYNTNTYDSKSNTLRRYLLTNGYVFYSRINNMHDFFILSESINGFPSSEFTVLGDSTLTKWVSLPPDSDYTKPR
jgi:hypothetical protein